MTTPKKKTQISPPGNIKRAEMEVRILTCRATQHRWEQTHQPRFSTTYPSGIGISFVCQTCFSERHDTWSQVTGEVLSRMYYHVEGYDQIGNLDSKSQIRRELMRKKRWLGKFATV